MRSLRVSEDRLGSQTDFKVDRRSATFPNTATSSAMVAVLLEDLDAEPAPVDAVAADQSVR
jgi:hypothetical protein